jgi:hypothetical protein
VQVYLPFGRWSFANLPINKANLPGPCKAGKQKKE